MSSQSRPLTIGIVGAGIGGLAAAALCAQSGHHVTLIERFATPRALGSGLVLQPVGLAVLDEIGADARTLGANITQMLGHAGRRKVLDVAYKPDAPGLAIHRASLFSLLWSAATAAGITLETGSACIDAPLTHNKRLIIRDNADPLGPFDLVIDASGAGSKLSPMQARPLGYGAVWGTVPWPDDTDLPRDHLSQRYQAARHMAGVLPIGQLPGNPTPHAAVFWSLPRAALDDWPNQDLSQWKAEVTQLWPQMASFLTTLHSPADLTPARYSHGTLRRPYTEALAYIGDSAHRASPQLGQGANMALLDAFALREALKLPLPEALPRYAQMRRWHVRAYQAMSAAFTPMYQSGSTTLPLLRDHLLAPMATLWPINRMLTALVSGTMLPPVAGMHWPQSAGQPTPKR
ncbi:MAG: NAD(P)/FAD-dependent oxidoreductase [Cypionkella sp.]|uniref:FAD-dependent oxidoreductase n=1 Tax=Cypionkella sp. TaxID=2811411 RepID=UPI002AB9671B|nr:NAD(P)/FAD-dependent oxidoreductase [Cypionkella sp.]MDZ4312348.1 NAD(P)/FAD-dependent oxidoreductase [Cypionkella sp.]